MMMMMTMYISLYIHIHNKKRLRCQFLIIIYMYTFARFYTIDYMHTQLLAFFFFLILLLLFLLSRCIHGLSANALVAVIRMQLQPFILLYCALRDCNCKQKRQKIKNVTVGIAMKRKRTFFSALPLFPEVCVLEFRSLKQTTPQISRKIFV